MTLWALFMALFSGTFDQAFLEALEALPYDSSAEMCLAEPAPEERVCYDVDSAVKRPRVEPGEVEGPLEEIECTEDTGVAGPSGAPIAVSSIFAVPPY